MNDESAVMFKVIAGVLILAFGLAGALAAKTLHARPQSVWLSVGNSFAAGIFIGAGLIHTLADSAGLFSDLYPTLDFPIWAALAGLAVILLLWIDKGLHVIADDGVSAITLFIVLSVHSLLAGMALGFESQPAQATAILLAIIAHKGSAAFALGLQNNSPGYWPRMLAFALMTPIGVLLGIGGALFLEGPASNRFEAVFDAIAAGTFIYVALFEILPTEFHRTQRVHLILGCTLAGYLLMALLALYV